MINSSTYQTQNQQAIPTTTILQHGQSFIRRQNSDGSFQDTDNNVVDFIIGEADSQNSSYQINTSTQQQSTTSTNNQINTNSTTTTSTVTTPTTTQSIDTTTSTTSSAPQTSSTTINYSTTTTISLWSFIKINEFVSDPESGNEWVELFNTATTSFDLFGGNICDNTLKSCKTTSGTIHAKSWLVMDLQTSKYLNNNGDSVILIDSDDDIVDQVDYGNNLASSDKGQSLARKLDGVDLDGSSDWSITTQITKGTTNIIVEPVQPVSSGSGGSNSSVQSDAEVESETNTTTTEQASTISTCDNCRKTGKVILTEIYPNPIGSDSLDEYIRITNLSGDTIDLTGWKLSDLAKKYKLSGFINSGQSIIWSRSSTTIALNNTQSEIVSLFDSQGILLDKVGYNKADEGKVYRRYDEEWKWEDKDNVLGVGGDKVEVINDKIDEVEQVDTSTSKQINTPTNKITEKQSTSREKVKPTLSLSLFQARSADKGIATRVNGIVSVLPNIFGSQYFYITDGTSGIQIYNFKKDFPKLAIGDKVEIFGEVSFAYGVNRINIKDKNFIDILATEQKVNIVSSTIGELSEENLGGLVKVIGLITEIKTNYMYLDDGSQEIKVYFKSGANIDKKVFKEGEDVEVVGVLEDTTSGWQLQPRSMSDIKSLGNLQYLINQNQVLSSAPNNSKDTTEKYLTATAGGIVTLILGFLARARGALALRGVKKVGLIALRVIKRG